MSTFRLSYCIMVLLLGSRHRLYYRNLLYVILFSLTNCDDNENRSHVEVRAVFIDCEPDGKDVMGDSDNARFQREELFKHNILRDCKKKLALTIKMTSEPGKSSGDEYIPIEHVFDGSKKKRVRLLNPFVLRLRREQPQEAYKIRRINTISGILLDTVENGVRYKKKNVAPKQRNSQSMAQNKECNKVSLQAQKRKKRFSSHSIRSKDFDDTSSITSHLHGNTLVCLEENASTKQVKQHKKTSSQYMDTNSYSLWSEDDNYQFPVQDRDIRDILNKEQHQEVLNRNQNRRYYYKDKKIPHDFGSSRLVDRKYGNYLKRDNFNKKYNVELFDPYKMATEKNHQIVPKENHLEKFDEVVASSNFSENSDEPYAVYEIGNPVLWNTVYIQLYEKISTPEGKTVWNDLTKEEVASVGTFHPEWNNGGMNIQYRSAESVSREKFYLPKPGLCLLIPIRGTDINDPGNDDNPVIDKFGEFLVLALDDLLSEKSAIKIKEKSSDLPMTNVSQQNEARRVLIHASRAIMEGSADSLIFASKGANRYMMIPHHRLHHSQIDVESRADGNQLIHVGSSGRIMTAVSDNTRRTRTTLTIQATNTGLAAARFRVAVRDCGPSLCEKINNEGIQGLTEGPALLPPKHTHRFKLELPFEIPDNYTHCHISLLNDDDDLVAVRDVGIKKDDRCFCVWHCNCVCLSIDPKLICREMNEAQQIAAGLSVDARPRRTRSICYQDNITLDIVVYVIGVLAALLTLGFVKAVLGLALRCIGSWGLDRLLQVPRRIDHYYESCLRYRPVIYDDDGWPIHPDTKKRSVRYISKPIEFMLNLIFFITMPCVIGSDALKSFISKCNNSESTVKSKLKPAGAKKRYSSQDIQVTVGGSGGQYHNLHKWMKLHADELTTEIWRKGLSVHQATDFNYMRPLLREECCRKSEDILSSYADSEQDDTDYVLMQMQKSRESLTRGQKKLTETSSKNHWKDDLIPSTSKR